MATLVFHQYARKCPNSMTLDFQYKIAGKWQSCDNFTPHEGIFVKLTVGNKDMMLEFMTHKLTQEINVQGEI